LISHHSQQVRNLGGTSDLSSTIQASFHRGISDNCSCAFVSLAGATGQTLNPVFIREKTVRFCYSLLKVTPDDANRYQTAINNYIKTDFRAYRAGQVLAISDFEQSPSDGFDEMGAEVWCV
jgi:hypothetical protein